MKRKKKKLLIVGAGLSAAVVCERALSMGYEVDVIENGDLLGGLCADNGDGTSIFGPHIFHTDSIKIWEYVNKFCTMVPYINSPVAENNGVYYHLPLNMWTLYQVFHLTDSGEARNKIQELANKEDTGWKENAEFYGKRRIGKELFDLFFKDYSEKQWKRPCSEIPSEIFSRIPVRYEWNNNYFNDTFQGIPLNGYTQMISNMMTGAKIHTCLPKEANLIGMHEYLKRVKNVYDKVFICQALDRAFGYSAGRIPYLKTKFVKVCRSSNGRKDIRAAVVNHCDHSTEATRTTDYRLLFPKERITGLLIDEIPLGEDLIDGVPAEETFEGNDKGWYSGDGWSKCCYPARDTALYQKYFEFAESLGFIVCGRLAENKYLDMSVAIENAMKKAKESL